MKKSKFDWNSPVTWKQSCILSGIGLAICAIYAIAMVIWFKWDEFTSTIRNIKERLTDMELWRSRKEKDRA